MKSAISAERVVLWSCSRFPGGRHWQASISLLNADGEGYEWCHDHWPKFTSHERALMWIEREFKALGEGYALADYMEQIHGVAAMRDEIRRRALPSADSPGKGR